MTPFTHSFINRIIPGLLAVVFLMSATWIQAETVQVNSIKPEYRDDHIILKIQTNGEAQYRLSELSRNRLELTVYNTIHTDLKQSPSILWQFMPTETIDVHEKNQNTYITFRLKSHSSYEVFHESAKDHILLNIGGDLAAEFRKNVIEFGSHHFEQLAASERNEIISILQDAPFDPRNSFLLGELNTALENGQIVWYEKMYEQVRGRKALSQDQLLQLANFYESQGDLAEAERTWYDYYQRAEKQLNANYTDTLPESSLIQYSDGNNKVIHGIISWIHGLFAKDFLLSLFAIVFVMAAMIGGYLAYDQRAELKQRLSLIWMNRHKKPEPTQESSDANPFDSFLKEIQDKVEDIPSAEKEQNPVPDMAGHGAEERQPEPEHVDTLYTAEEAEQSMEEVQEFANASSTRKNNVLRQAEVVDLYKMSVEPEVIAKNLNMSRSEVELLLKISGSVSKTQTTQRKRRIQYDDSFADMSLNDMAQEMKISVEEAKLLRLKGQREHFSA